MGRKLTRFKSVGEVDTPSSPFLPQLGPYPWLPYQYKAEEGISIHA